jgi:hypothetical protein
MMRIKKRAIPTRKNGKDIKSGSSINGIIGPENSML